MKKVEVIVIAEGQTEEAFIKQVVAPALHHLQVFLKPQLLNTSKTAQGGAVSFDRLKRNASNTLKQHPDAVLSTFLDLYGLRTDFPGFEESKQKSDVYARVRYLQEEMSQAIVEQVKCRPERFMAHIQPYEFEGLLFSDVKALCSIEPTWAKSLPHLEKIRTAVVTPEHINDSIETKPSKRLEKLLKPKYQKTTHGPTAAKKITLEVMEIECVHFKKWMDTLRKLAP